MKLQIITFNTAASIPSQISKLDPLFPCIQIPNLIVFAFQELLAHSNLIIYSRPNETCNPNIKNSILNDWLNKIQETLDQRFTTNKFQCVFSNRTCALGLLIFESSPSLIKSASFGSIGSGLGGWYRNKGALSIVLNVKIESRTLSICFIGAHLQAHQGAHNNNYRNEEIKYIFDALVVEERFVNDNNVVFLAGDLNYRINMTDIHKSINANDIDAILQHDELTQNMSLDLFNGYVESPISFPPTYKLSCQNVYSKKRLPAYCDRILYKYDPDVQVNCEYYSSCEVFGSDHLPVVGMFEILVKPDIERLRRRTTTGDNDFKKGDGFDRDRVLKALRRRVFKYTIVPTAAILFLIYLIRKFLGI